MALLQMNPVTTPKAIQAMNESAEFSRRSESKRPTVAISMIDMLFLPPQVVSGHLGTTRRALSISAGRSEFDLSEE
jgi:hypothetical protein